jgi:hypothetical protein
MKKVLYFALAAFTAFSLVACIEDKDDPQKPDDPGKDKPENPQQPENPEQPGDQTVTLVINEVNGTKGYKGIEIYNPSDKEVDLKGWSIKKNEEVTDADKGTTLYWEGVDGVGKIAAKGYYVIHASKDDGELPEKTEGCVATGGLSNKKGVKLELINPEGKTVDTFNRGFDASAEIPEAPLDELNGSFARDTDGGKDWKLKEPSFGATNNGVALVGDGVITGM